MKHAEVFRFVREIPFACQGELVCVETLARFRRIQISQDGATLQCGERHELDEDHPRDGLRLSFETELCVFCTKCHQILDMETLELYGFKVFAPWVDAWGQPKQLNIQEVFEEFNEQASQVR